MPRKLARNRLISTISIISLQIDFKQKKNVTIAGVSAELSGRGRWRGRGHLHIQGELAFFYFDKDDNPKLLFQQNQPNGPRHGP